MSSIKCPVHKGHLFAFSALLLVAALAFVIAPASSEAAGGARLSGTGQDAFASINSRLGTLVPPVFGPNVPANTDATNFGQHEPSLAVSRVNTNTVFVAAKDYREGNIKRVWIDGSTDGGVTWPVQLRMPNLPTTESESDPVVMARDDGRIYVSCLTTGNNGIWITWTDDDGRTWQPSVPIVQNQSGLQDKDWFAIDNNPASPYYHRMYMMYAPDAARVVEHHSTDGGLTWSARQQIGATNTEYTYPVVASDGTVYNFMMLNWGPSRVGTVQMTKSTNGGVTWTTPTTVTTAQQPASPIRQTDQFRFFAILSAAVDPNTGALYVAWTDDRNITTNGTDVVYVKSTNGGASWGPITRLSHDPTGVVRDHITPMLAVGEDSRLHAFWLDRRLDPNNRLFDSWYSSSTDGGTTWDPDTRVSTEPQDLNLGFPPGSNNAAGDYWGLDVWRDTVYVAWNDARLNSQQDILVSKGLMQGGATSTPSPTFTVVPPTPSPTFTVVVPTLTATAVLPTSTSTIVPPTVIATNSPVINTPTGTAIPTATPVDFLDVPPSNTFYAAIRCLAGRAIVSGYSDGTFRPNNPVTRGQLAKIVSNSAGFSEAGSGQVFQDVPSSHTFYEFVQRLTNRGYMTGYVCGGPGEPCINNRPYFRPQSNATRGQTSKIVSNAAMFTEPPAGQTFEDVPANHTFYEFIQRLASRDVMQGYPCGEPGEPCLTGRPYFRPGNDVTRGQSAKIAANAFFPGCQAVQR